MAARDEKIMVRLSTDIKNEFQELADEYGMTMSALAAFVIGQFVRTQRRVVEPIIEQMAETARQAVKQAIDEAKERSA